MIVEPFPTLYWLTSPILRMHVSEIEKSTSNGVSSVEERLRSSLEYVRNMERAHESYGRRRWELLTMEDMELSIRRGWRTALDETRGVAGIARRRRRAPIADGDECCETAGCCRLSTSSSVAVLLGLIKFEFL